MSALTKPLETADDATLVARVQQADTAAFEVQIRR
jgi:hypothetical protein